MQPFYPPSYALPHRVPSIALKRPPGKLPLDHCRSSPLLIRHRLQDPGPLSPTPFAIPAAFPGTGDVLETHSSAALRHQLQRGERPALQHPFCPAPKDNPQREWKRIWPPHGRQLPASQERQRKVPRPHLRTWEIQTELRVAPKLAREQLEVARRRLGRVNNVPTGPGFGPRETQVRGAGPSRERRKCQTRHEWGPLQETAVGRESLEH